MKGTRLATVLGEAASTVFQKNLPPYGQWCIQALTQGIQNHTTLEAGIKDWKPIEKHTSRDEKAMPLKVIASIHLSVIDCNGTEDAIYIKMWIAKMTTVDLQCIHFLVGAFPEVQYQFRKQFSDKVLYNYCKKIKRFSQYKKKSRIRERSNLSTDADRRTYTILERLRDL